jgi:peptidoglycan/xylan/chitin deacetylase (PgdA/CDA1 family)
MRQVAENFVAGTRLPDGALAITVDDGYHDFLLNAQPVFSMYAIPVTVFLVTDFVDGRRWLWWDHVKYMFAHTSRASLRFAGGEFEIESDRKYAAHKVTETLKQMPHAEFRSQLAMLPKLLEVEIPEHAPAEYEPLSWEDVRQLAAAGVEFGVHTKTHPILSKLTDGAQLHEEVAGSKKRLEEELAVPSLHFCYPNGTRDDYNEQTLAIVKRCGFTTAVTAECGFNYAGVDPLQFLRVGVEPLMSEQFFAQLLAGVRSHRKGAITVPVVYRK